MVGSLFLQVFLVLCIVILKAQATEEALSEHYRSIFTAANFSGIVAAWSEKDLEAKAPLYKELFGKFSYQYDIPMKSDARFPIGSNTKLYIAISMYQLQEAGKVNLSANVADYLYQSDFAAFGYPQWTKYCPHLEATPGSCESLTFVQLMAMQGGIEGQHLQFLPFPGSLGEVVGRYIGAPLVFRPGSRYMYSNPSFMLCAYFIEKLSGISLAQYLSDNIFTPLGLKDTYYNQQDEMFSLDPKRVSENIRYVDPATKELSSLGKCNMELQLGSSNGAGGLVGTIEDEAKLYFSVFNFTGSLGGGILSASSVLELVKARTPGAGLPGHVQAYYGQGLFINTTNASNAIPDQIVYEGGIICVYTANVLDLTQNPPLMGQAFTNTPVLYASRWEVDLEKALGFGSWFDLTGIMDRPPATLTLAKELIDLISSTQKI